MAISITISKNGNHLVFVEAVFEDGIAVAGSVKIGVLAIEDPKKAEATLKKAKTMSWLMEEQQENSDFYLVERA